MLRGWISIASCIILVAFFTLCDGKVYVNDVSITAFRRQKGWMFLDRMNFQKGKVEITFKASILANQIRQGNKFSIQLALIDDALWKQEQTHKCQRSKDRSSEIEAQKHEIVVVAELDFKDGYKGENKIEIEFETERTFHFVLRDCSNSILREHFSRETKIGINLNMVNNGKFISRTESYLGYFLPLLIAAIIWMIIYSFKKKDQEEEENWTIYLLKIALWFSLISIIIKYMGYFIYAYINGRDYAVFDFLYLLLHSTSDAIVSTLITLLGYGWTVTFVNSHDFDLYIPLISMLGLVNVIMTLLNKITDGEHDKYHMFDTIPAYILVFFKLLGFLLFLIGIIRSFFLLKKDETRLKKFFTQLAIIGFFNLSLIPLSMYIVQFIDAHLRKDIIFFFIQIVRNLVNLILIFMGRSKNSVYRSIVSRSFMEKNQKYL